MPKENKHTRGRRGAKEGKRKRSDEEDGEHHGKRQRSDAEEEVQFFGTDNIQDEAHAQDPTERPFYGLLDEEEQEYFRHADELLELNDFPSQEDQSHFLTNVLKEAEGKELKIANSQSCSRLMERLILLSTTDQKKTLFEKFSGNFLHLVQHRFASHCCEALFIHSAYVVTQELITDSVGQERQETKDGEVVHASMETLFLNTLKELDGHMGLLLTDRFASHVLRVLLVVLSGQPLAKSSTRSLLQSKKKEKISITGVEPSSAELSLNKRTVPESFDQAIGKIISGTARALDSTFIHIIATHPTGNPTLQLLLELEFKAQGKQKLSPESASVITKLLPDDLSTTNSKSSSFINGLIYEPIGSRLLETMVKFAPGKLFKQIYRATFKERIGSLARNDIASYVVIKVLERLSKADLEESVALILPQIPGLIERSRTTVIKTLLERCHARDTPDSIALLTKAIEESYGSDANTLLLKMANIDLKGLATSTPAEPSTKSTKTDPTTTHGSLLAQAMLSIPGPPTTLLQTSILTLPPTTLHELARTAGPSHIIQTALTPTPTNLSFRRKLINAIITTTADQHPHPILTLALDKVGSHVLDALFTSTHHLMNLKERVCSILHAHIDALREDFIGRVVLRVWMVELFSRRRDEWIRKVKTMTIAGDGVSLLAAPVPVLDMAHGKTGDGAVVKKGGKGRKGEVRIGNDFEGGKTAIELARERFAAGKVKRAGKRREKGKGKVGKVDELGMGNEVARGKFVAGKERGKGTRANASLL